MGDDDLSSSRRLTIGRKRDGKMKLEIRPNYTDEEDEDQANGDERHVADMDSLIAAARKAQKIPQPPPQIILHQVPGWMRQRFPDENFDPEVVALGPLHHHQPHLKQFQRIKIAAFRYYVALLLPAAGGGRIDDPDNHRVASVVQNLWEAVAKEVLDENQKPKHYRDKAMSKHGVADEKALVCMMLMDGCFLLHFIETANAGKPYPIIGDHVVPLVVHDMFLLENQIPFPVLLVLYKAIYGGGREVALRGQIMQFIHTRILFPSFFNLTGRSWRLGPSWNIANTLQVSDDEQWRSVAHLLYLLRHFVLGKPKKAAAASAVGAARASQPKHDVPPLHTFGSVMELKDAGIKFRNSSARNLTEIAFKKNVFFPEILVPPIVITRTTICYILNMIAWELRLDNPADRGITSYVSFLNSVINHSEDVKELRLQRVLYHGLGSDEDVADLFNHWPIDAMGELPVCRDVSEYIYEHRQKPWKLSIAEFKYTHFRTPWTTISLLAAIVLLALTLLQTIYAIKQSSDRSPPASPPPPYFR